MTVAAPPATKLTNYINGQWTDSRSSEWRDVVNPATGEILASVPMADAAEVATAVEAAAAAFPEWRRTPPEDRIQPLFKLKMLLEEHIDDIARTITIENGKTFTEAKAEMRRAIENVEVACGIPMMMQGYNLEDVARGIDEMMIRQPIGVTAAIVPFNFPGMIAFWYLPYAIATGNTFILKPSERVPLTMRYIYELLAKTGLPKGVVNLVNGGKAVVDALSIIPRCAPSASSDRLRWRATSTRVRASKGSDASAKGARRTTWSCFPTRTCQWRRRSSATAHSAVRDSVALPFRSRSRLAKRRRHSVIRLPTLPRNFALATGLKMACRWDRSSPRRVKSVWNR